MDDRLDVQPQDEDVLEEIELISNLMIAASEASGPLPQTAIDTILGILGPAPPRVASRQSADALTGRDVVRPSTQGASVRPGRRTFTVATVFPRSTGVSCAVASASG